MINEYKELKDLIKLLCKQYIFERRNFNSRLMKKMGYKFIGKNKRIGSDAFIHSKDDNNSKYHKN